MTGVTWHESEQLEVVSNANLGATRSAQTGDNPLPSFLSDPAINEVFEIVESNSFVTRPTVRSSAPASVNVTVEVEDGAEYLLIMRSPSDAISFHDGKRTAINGTRSLAPNNRPENYKIEFKVPVPLTANDEVRRGALGNFAKRVIDAVIVKVVNFVAEVAIDKAEAAIWRLLGRKRGIHRVGRDENGLSLTPVRGKMKPSQNGRALLLIHGTFSTTQGSFGSFADRRFFDQLSSIYGSEIYGFEHFSVSVSPEENALELLKKMPVDGITCDVITHSRGGLVLRNLVERKDLLQNGDRFTLGRATLVACPNEGTPLATPTRWNETVGWLANILDMFPPNPMSSNAALLARWITWFVKFGVNAAEGLSSMDMTGDQIRRLQSPPAPDPGKYSAIVTNFEPDASVWARALDLGVDWFFENANDLVVPTAGGYRIDRSLDSIPENQVGVFGPGGNIVSQAGKPHHLDIVSFPETHTFLLNALQGKAQNLPNFDAGIPLPTRRRSTSDNIQSEAANVASNTSAAVPQNTYFESPPAASRETVAPSLSDAPVFNIASQPMSSVFELTVFDPNQIENFGFPAPEIDGESAPFLYAAYGGARILVPFWFKKSHVPNDVGDPVMDKRLKAMVAEINDRRGNLFGYHRKVKDFLDGEEDAPPLRQDEMQEFGHYLFKTLFPDEVKRLYDVARAREQDKMFLIFTSMIPWVFDMPWEFAVDLERGSQLAIEDVHFIRNVLTHNPVEKLKPKKKFRMLAVAAQPTDLGQISSDEEIAKLRFSLEPLISSGLVEFETLAHATAQKLHHAIATGNYDVLHFIGHGYWDKSRRDSGLVLENDQGSSYELGGTALREVLSQRGLRLVFLNACDTGRSIRGSTDKDRTSLAGVAQDLFGRGMPNIIANQYPVGDGVAVAFAQSVYKFLAHGKTMAQAVREARIATKFESDGHSMDWAIPVVYARDPEDRLVINQNV